MLSQSLAELLPTAGYPELAEKEALITVNHLYNSAKRTHERLNFDLEAIVKIYKNVEIWPTYLSLLCSETKAKVNVSYINYDFKDKREW